ncbi:MAG: DNA helicase, partial [Chloroflexi bacterium]
MSNLRVKISPEDSAITQYLQAKQALIKKQGVSGEGQLRSAFADLLKGVASKRNWMLVEELSERVKGRTIRPDGTLRDEWRLPHGYWEAKDSADDLRSEVHKKRERGYPFSNIIFEDTQQAILYQDEQQVLEADLSDPEDIARLLSEFLSYDVPPFSEFEEAVDAFKEQVPRIAQELMKRIKAAHRENKAFQAAYAAFRELCQNSLNPNISDDAIDEMLIQHLLTERLIRRIFKAETFTRRNVIARKVEDVIDALTSKHFNRTQFLGSLDRFYTAIENAADRLADIQEKQHFLNTVYERFFQGYSVQVADTHGIVYTPQPIVDFMCAAVEEVLRDEFHTELGDDNVYVLDPCTGTGSFIVNLLHRVNVRNRPAFYKERLFANEVMLMPYYIASLNIEHEYNQLEGRYEPFEGICFVDTLDIAKQAQMAMFTEENAERVQRQLQAPITVIIGNPPYNVGQVNENDNNKNRQYPVVDARVRDTYAAASA